MLHIFVVSLRFILYKHPTVVAKTIRLFFIPCGKWLMKRWNRSGWCIILGDFFYVRMGFSLLISFIESSAACQKLYPLFASDSISTYIFLSSIYQALASGGIVIPAKSYILICLYFVSTLLSSLPPLYKMLSLLSSLMLIYTLGPSVMCFNLNNACLNEKLLLKCHRGWSRETYFTVSWRDINFTVYICWHGMRELRNVEHVHVTNLKE